MQHDALRSQWLSRQAGSSTTPSGWTRTTWTIHCN